MKRFKQLLAVTILTISALTIAVFAQVESEPEQKLTASERHEILARGKAEKLAQSREIAEILKMALAANQTDFDVNFYRIEIDVDIPAEMIYGDVRMEAKSAVDGLAEINLDLVNNLTVDSVYVPGGGQLVYTHNSNVLGVTLDATYNTGESFQVGVTYHGLPPMSGFVGFSFDYHLGKPVVSTLSEPYMARSWWPCKDRPDDKADSLDIFITCDTAVYCASNGSLIDTTVNGDGTWTFNYEVRYPITTYLFSLAISDYTVWNDWYHYSPTDSMEIVHHVYSDQYTYSLPRWSVTPYAIEIFSNLYGEYPFLNEKYGHANFEWGGGMEHQTVTSMTGSWFGFDTNTVVHELAHQWWGDMITCNNWHEIWLNEGFASYSEALFWEVASGTARFREEMEDMEYFNYGSIYRQDTTNVGSIFSSIVYDKGAWVLHMLRHVVGDDDFFEILQTYYGSQYQYGDATTEQFQAICEQVSGKDLDYFFSQWIYGNYYPIYRYEMYTEHDYSVGDYYVYVYLRQTQSSQPVFYTMPLDFEFVSGGQRDTQSVFNDVRDSVYIFKSSFSPIIMGLDPENWVLNGAANPAWVYHLIPHPLDTGTAYEEYLDTLRARGGTGNNRYYILSGNIPSGLALDSATGVITGMPTEYGTFMLNVRARDASGTYADTSTYALSIQEGIGTPGDVNGDEAVDILDIVFLVNYKFKEGEAPEYLRLADVNADCVVNILDVIYLVEYKFKGGPAPLMGCPGL